MSMHWDWATFIIGVFAGGVGGLGIALFLFYLFAKGMSDE